jgi:ketosteroid isomerase-like protein
MNTNEVAAKYVAMCKEGKHGEIVTELFAPDAVSIEAFAPPGGQRTTKGIEGILGKSKWWNENHIVHKAEVFGPYPHDDRFAVRFFYDITNKPSQKRMSMDEVALFTVSNGKIVKEEFFYTAG